MSLSTSSVEGLARPRILVALVAAAAAFSIGYYTYRTNRDALDGLGTGAGSGGLRRSNAVRRARRQSRENAEVESSYSPTSSSSSSSSSDAVADENANSNANPGRDWWQAEDQPIPDGDTVVNTGVDEWWNDPGGLPNQRTGFNIVNLLFRVSEDNARRNGCVHRGCQCNSCGTVPIRGVRYRCANCADFDLCETCEAQGIHVKTHIFYKIRVPAPPFGPRQMQPVWYTGDPDTCQRNLPKTLISRLSADTGFERPELEAFWEQWTFMANTEWREDPDELFVAMDRKTFERCLVPTGGSRHAAPNLIHDRMFHFYDSNYDNLIGFSEFLHGLAYRKSKNKLRKVFEGYDMDSDGFVDRRDFLRMFRAYYVLYKQMHKDILDGLEDQLLASTEAQQLVASRQPLSSLFGREGRIPPGDRAYAQRFEGKNYRPDGAVDVTNGFHHATVDDKPDTANRDEMLTSLFAYQSDQEPPQRFAADPEDDSNWRSAAHRSSSHDMAADEAYWRALLNPPTTVAELADAALGNRPVDDDDDSDSYLFRSAEDTDDGEFARNGSRGASPRVGPSSESAARANGLEKERRRAPKLDKRRRKMARARLHERWKRRQFYLDEEEGGHAPAGWRDDEDRLLNIRELLDDAKAEPLRGDVRSRSNSKVRFAQDLGGPAQDGDDNSDVLSNPSTSSRGLYERWGTGRIPTAERDAGKEILYQVTQQAFNELLDTIFKPAEDLAVQAANTKAQREKYKNLLDKTELKEDNKPDGSRREGEANGSDAPTAGTPYKDKPVEELLALTGYTVDASAEPRNAVEIDPTAVADGEVEDDDDEAEDDDNGAEDDEYETTSMESEAAMESIGLCDPTLPQFRPDSAAEADDYLPGDLIVYEPSYPLTQEPYRPRPRRSRPNEFSIPEEENEEGRTEEEEVEDEDPSPGLLQLWKRLDRAEKQAAERGGWGKLNFEEFERTYKNQEQAGNRLDYLGSWIDFCIP